MNLNNKFKFWRSQKKFNTEKVSNQPFNNLFQTLILQLLITAAPTLRSQDPPAPYEAGLWGVSRLKRRVTDNHHFQLLYNPSIHRPQTALWRWVKIIIPITQREKLRQRELKGFILQHQATWRARERANRPSRNPCRGDFWVSESFPFSSEGKWPSPATPASLPASTRDRGWTKQGLCVEASLLPQSFSPSHTIPVTPSFYLAAAWLGLSSPFMEGLQSSGLPSRRTAGDCRSDSWRSTRKVSWCWGCGQVQNWAVKSPPCLPEFPSLLTPQVTGVGQPMSKWPRLATENHFDIKGF